MTIFHAVWCYPHWIKTWIETSFFRSALLSSFDVVFLRECKELVFIYFSTSFAFQLLCFDHLRRCELVAFWNRVSVCLNVVYHRRSCFPHASIFSSLDLVAAVIACTFLPWAGNHSRNTNIKSAAQAQSYCGVHNVRHSVGHVELYTYTRCLSRCSVQPIHLHLARHTKFSNILFRDTCTTWHD